VSDFGLGDLIIQEDILIKTLKWHGLLDDPPKEGVVTMTGNRSTTVNIALDKKRLGHRDSSKDLKSSESE